MKRFIMWSYAHLTFIIGDLCCIFSISLNSDTLFDWYQKLMNISFKINEKYNFGMWNKPEKDD